MIGFYLVDWIMRKKFSTESKIDQYARKGVRIGINKSFESGIDITAQGIFRKIDYQDYNALLGKTRKDNEQKISVYICYS